MTTRTYYWSPLTSAPPVLSSHYDFAAPPPVHQVSVIDVNSGAGSRPHVEGQIFVTAHWQMIFAACATPNTPFEKSIAITYGGEADQSTVDTIGLSLGVAGKYGSISAAISAKTAQKISFNAQTTTTTNFSVTPTKVRTTVVWWQAVYTYTLKGQVWTHPDREFPEGHSVDCSMLVYDAHYVATQYPEPKGGKPTVVSLV